MPTNFQMPDFAFCEKLTKKPYIFYWRGVWGWHPCVDLIGNNPDHHDKNIAAMKWCARMNEKANL